MGKEVLKQNCNDEDMDELILEGIDKLLESIKNAQKKSTEL